MDDTLRNQKMRSEPSIAAWLTLRCSRWSIGTDAAESFGSPGCALWRIFITASCRFCASFLGLGLVAVEARAGGEVAGLEPKCLAKRAFAAAFFSCTGSAGVMSGGVQAWVLGSLCLWTRVPSERAQARKRREGLTERRMLGCRPDILRASGSWCLWDWQ